jgi:hypothetical protein
MPEEHRDDAGRGWIAFIHDGYSASIQGSTADPTIYDDGVDGVTLAEALAWARSRTDWVVVRPQWDPGVHYWAGVGPVPANVELGQDEVPVLPEEGPGRRAGRP